VIFAGIDPGKSGALALLDERGEPLELFPVPIVVGTGRPEYDLARIAETLHAWRGREVFVTIEKQQPLPRKKGGGITNYSRGVSSGWLWMFTALKIPHHLVSPPVWQRRMFEGAPGTDTKQRAIIAAGRLFPGVSLLRTPRSRKPFDGFADALLIAEYGRRWRVA
jgi:crossover junction endodeoxyribonuclease RuvC